MEKHVKSILRRCFYLLLILFISKTITAEEQELQNSKPVFLPSGPFSSTKFGAFYTKLLFEPHWDSLWPVSIVADVVVRFDNNEPRFVFWRGTSYIPCWATFNGPWFTNEFFERRGGAKSGTLSMVEPMSDKQCRYSNIRIIENNDARTVIHWRYAPTDLNYNLAYIDNATQWGDWADEIYVIYPDAVAIRNATIHTSSINDWIEYQESIVLNQPGTYPEDNIDVDAITLLNLSGESKTYSWTNEGSPELLNPPEEFCIQKVNFKSEYKPYSIINPKGATIVSYGGHAPGSYFNFWNHWPVSQVKSDTRVADSKIWPSHTSLSHLTWKTFHEDQDSKTWIMMNGMTNDCDNHLVSLAKSWISPPQVNIIRGSFINDGYDPSQRAYIISSNAAPGKSFLSFELLSNKVSPVINPAFLIKGWYKKDLSIRIDGKPVSRGNDFRYGQVNREDGSDLIIWLRLTSTNKVTIEFF